MGNSLSGPDVFISYSREDRTTARRFAERFADAGYSVWWDAALHSGETFDEVIENALKAAKAVVVLWSPRSVASRWVRAEATLADRRNKLVPVIIEPCDRPIIFELTHTTDLSHWNGSTKDAAWASLIKDVQRLVKRAEQAEYNASPGSGSTVAPDLPKFTPPPVIPARKSGDLNGSAQHRKIDNALFAKRTLGEEPADDHEDRTQFYTKSDGFVEDDELHCLELTIGDRLEKRFIVSPLGLKIGRAAPADIILADSRVSRSHCQIELTGNELQVSDLNSTNGTFVDGEKVEGSTLLPVGSVLKVGDITFKHEVRSRAEV
jgi:hypothetical protein